ncbi:CAMKK/CAMKK-META protein kinase [Helicocarpus griseus UAMH5409]|uniref:CAMKK/CAMKK-META protein kinase n=1 Tax=Helicocarpus griseus UAMH5409 TaxID=1447875 RepID=A0A2B7Y9M3_9EURO|nr:CAMKK/CAMKK-META protein kinase [Helicocarpus griseus UAMH5409]
MAQDLSSSEHQKKVVRKITVDCSRAVESSTSRSATPSYDSPARHHTRNHTAPRKVKETLNARSEYTNSQDDGAAEHRINQYLIKQEIGRGSFGAVHLAIDQYGQEYAVKEFSKSRLRKRAQSHVLRNPRAIRRPGVIPAGVGLNSPLHRHPSGHEDEQGGNPLYLIKEEIAIMKKLHHNNLVSLIEVLDDPTEDSLYMVMEMCKKGVIMKVGLGQGSDPYDDESCRCWFRDLILGIEYLHAQSIVHRDIKPDNCLLTNDDVLKVVDFGVSEMFEKDSHMFTAKSAGSPAFLPPELCVAKHGDVSGTAADIWSMGVTLYCLRYGRIPFEKESIVELYASILNDEVNYGDEQDEDFKHLMSRILEKDPTKRIKMPELREHPWVTRRGADLLLSAEENTANIVGDPTEEEVNSAITKKIGNVLTVVKAVRKFKRLIKLESPIPMESILGQGAESHFVQPPLSMESPEEVDFPSAQVADPNSLTGAWSTHSKSGSTDSRRQFLEKGVYMHPAMQKSASTSRLTSTQGDSFQAISSAASTTKSVSPPPQASRANTPSKQSFSEGTRGHARDPLEEEHSFLFIGPSTFTGELKEEDEKTSPDYFSRAIASGDSDAAPDGFPSPEMGMVPIVSESPGASDIDIYETAYTEEVERIRKQSLAPKVYLNRRVEGRKSSLADLLRQATIDGKSPEQRSPSLAQVVTGLSSTPSLSKAQNEMVTSETAAAVGSTETPSEVQGAEVDAKAKGPASEPVDPPQSTTSPASSTPSLSTKATGAAVAVTGTSDATAETVTTSTTQKSRSGLRSLLGRVRRESTHFGKK